MTSSIPHAWVLLSLLHLLLTVQTALSSTNQNDLMVSAYSCEQEPDQLPLDAALQSLSSNQAIYLEDGEHCIANFSLVSGLRNISLVGKSKLTTVIRCKKGFGLSFSNVSDLLFKNLTVDGCGLSGQPLNEVIAYLSQFFDQFVQVLDGATVAMILGYVNGLRMEQVAVTNTKGLGLLGVNVIGESYLSDVEFINNIQPSTCSLNGTTAGQVTVDPGYVGGGANFIFYDFLSESNTTERPNDAPRMILDRARFFNNSDCAYSLQLYAGYYYSRAIQRIGYMIGNSGGLAVLLAQLEYGVDFRVQSSHFINNKARYGSGAAVLMFSAVRDTSFVFDNCLFLQNGFTLEEMAADALGAFALGGGGVSVVEQLYRPGYEVQPLPGPNVNLTVEISNSNFTANGARIGGGLGVYTLSTAAIRGISDSPRLLVENSVFERNMALLGAAILMLDQGKFYSLAPGPLVELSSVRVERNVARPLSSSVTHSQDNSAATDFRGQNVTLSGTCYFVENTGTGLQASSSLIGLGVNATAYFERNVGVFGGGMTFLFNSYLILNSNSSLYLRENVGNSQGGAFYVNLLRGNNALFYDDCFLLFSYQDFSLCDEGCADLNGTGVYVEIFENAAVYDGSIVYGSTLQFCPWAQQLRLGGYNETTVFRTLNRYFPTVFNFSQEPTSAMQVTTPARMLLISDPQPSYTLVPGSRFSLNVSLYDGLGNLIPGIISTYVSAVDGQTNAEDIRNTLSFINSGFAFIGNGSQEIRPSILSTENHTISIIMYSFDCVSIAQQEIVVNVGFCPTGLVFNQDSRTCECDQRLIDEGLTCSVDDLTIAVPNDVWYGPISEGSNETVVYNCLEDYCEPETNYISVASEPIDYDVQCYNGSNRRGFLCGSCKDGYSFILGSSRCLKCNNGHVALILVFLLLGVLLVTMISFLRITLTVGYINGAIFYANIVTLYGAYLFPSSPYTDALTFASFLSLNLGIETCFYDGMTALEKVWWQLSFPLYLIFLMLGIGVLARFVKWKRGAGLSIIQGISTLMILCYLSVLQSSVELISFNRVRTLSGSYEVRWAVDPTVEYFRGAHGFLAFVAICLMILYVIPLPIFLLFPQILYRVRYLRNLKPFYDAIWHPFETKFRFWLGLRLMFRWIPHLLLFFLSDPHNLFGTALLLILLLFVHLLAKPFRGFWRNLSDELFLVNLVIMFVGSLYFRSLDDDIDPQLDTDRSQAASFSTVFINLAYIGFVVVLVYHIILRFPKLQKALRYVWEYKKRRKSQLVVNQDNMETSLTARRKESGGPTLPSPGFVTCAELREPLLDSDTVAEVVTLPSRPRTDPEYTTRNTT